jgi:hypothetical protein
MRTSNHIVQRRALVTVAIALATPDCLCLAALSSDPPSDAEAPRAASPGVTLVEKESAPIGSIFSTGDFVYFTVGAAIRRVPANGGAAADVFRAQAPVKSIEIVGVDDTQVFFTETENGPATRIRRIARTGATTATTMAEAPKIAAVALAGSRVVYLEHRTKTASLRSIAKTGGAEVMLAAEAAAPESRDLPIALGADGDGVYWLYPNGKLLGTTCEVRFVAAAGGTPRVVTRSESGACGGDVMRIGDRVLFVLLTQSEDGALLPGTTGERQASQRETMFEAPSAGGASRPSKSKAGYFTRDAQGFFYAGAEHTVTFIPAAGPPGRTIPFGEGGIARVALDAGHVYVATQTGAIRKVPR